MKSQLPPGPRMPAVAADARHLERPTAFLDRPRARYGQRFTVRLLGQPPFVVLSDPDEIKQVFMAPPDVLHPGEGARILEPLVGPHSVILLDEDAHMEQRKLLLPAFHGERMQRLAGLMRELTERELVDWPRGGADRAAPAAAAPDARDRPARRLRPRAWRAAGRAARAAHADPRVQR